MSNMRYVDKEGLIALAAVASTLNDEDIRGIEDRIAKIKNGNRDLALIRRMSESLLYKVIEAMPMDKDDAKDVRRYLSTMKIYTGIRNTPRHGRLDPLKDFGMYLTYDEVNALLEASTASCALCTKTDGEAKNCKVRKIIAKLPVKDVEHTADKCGYSREFEKIMFGED